MTLQFILIIAVFSFVLFNNLEAFLMSSSSSTCAVTDKENKVTRIICPSNSIISNIHFASYGNPEGVCGNYTVGSCHGTQSMNIVMNECLNKNKCSIIPSNDVFVLPVDACHDFVTKLLYVEVSCKASSNNVSISSMISDILPISSSITTTSSVCMIGWVFYDNKCYKFNLGYFFSWSGCKSQCASLGASMLCILDSTTNIWIANQLLTQLGSSNSNSWIGYSDLPNNDGNYEWVSGCSSSYSNSAYYYNNDCVYISTSNAAWYDFSDYGSSSIACSCEYSISPTSLPTLSPTSPTVNPSTTLPSSAPSTIAPSVGCQSGWSYHDANCYQFNIRADLSWSGCKSQCASLGASMLCIPDEATNTWIANQISLKGDYSNSWIGFSVLPINDGKYKWVSGCSSSYTRSSYNYYDKECYYLGYTGYWYNSDDSSWSSITCSCQYSIAPTSFPTPSLTSPTVDPTPIVDCQSGWSLFNNNCYNFNVGNYFTWSGCKSECASLGASMLCIPDSTTNNWIANQISQNGFSKSWIGYSDLPNNDGNYEWVSGCSSSSSNSYYGNNYYSYDCVYIEAYNGAWYSSGDYGYYSIACSCEYPIAPTSLPTLSPTSPTVNPTPIVGCQVGWSYYKNNCYKFNVGYYFTWSGCKSQCASLGASMLCIPGSTTNTWIANQIYSKLGYYYSWIGYSDLPNNDGNYEWVSGCSSSYSNSAYGNYDCVYISASSGYWYSSSDYGQSDVACSCQYSIPSTLLPTLSPSTQSGEYLFASTSLPTISPSTQSGDDDDTSATIGIVVGCVVFVIIVIPILIYFFCNRTNAVCISLLKFPSNNDDISSRNQAYTDIPPTCPYPPSDDDDGGLVISSSTKELQIVVTNVDHCAYDDIDTYETTKVSAVNSFTTMSTHTVKSAANIDDIPKLLEGHHLQEEIKCNDDTNDNISSTITVDDNTSNTDDTGFRHEHDVFEIQRIQGKFQSDMNSPINYKTPEAARLTQVATDFARGGLMIASIAPFIRPVALLLLDLIDICDQSKCNKNSFIKLKQRMIRFYTIYFSENGVCDILEAEERIKLTTIIQNLEKVVNNAMNILSGYSTTGWISKLFTAYKWKHEFDSIDEEITNCFLEINIILQVGQNNIEKTSYSILTNIQMKIDQGLLNLTQQESEELGIDNLFELKQAVIDYTSKNVEQYEKIMNDMKIMKDIISNKNEFRDENIMKMLKEFQAVKEFMTKPTVQNQYSSSELHLWEPQEEPNVFIDDLLGEGHFGVVYNAKYRNQIVAIKVSKSLFLDPSFKREILIHLKLCTFPGIVQIKAVSLEKIKYTNYPLNFPYIIMEKAECSLADSIYNNTLGRDFTIMDKINLCLQVASALSFINSAFVIHRDIKPSNILLFRDSIKNQQLTFTAKICDFGLAKYDADVSQTTITDATGKGTLAYMAPELLHKRPINYSTKSDIYAYAITLNEVLLEERPYANLVQIQPTDRPILTTIPGVTGDCLRALITSCWSDEISTRPSFNDIYQELSNIFQEVVFETKYGSRASRSYLFGSSIKQQQQYEYQYQQNQGMISNIEITKQLKDLSVYEIGQLMINANYPKLKTVFCDLEISGKTVNYCACIDDILELTKDYYYKIPKSTAQALLEDIKQWKVDGVRLNVLSK